MLHSSVRKTADLLESQKQRMLELMEVCYQGVDVKRFAEDLAEKEGCILLRDDGREIQGFSTFVILHESYEGRQVAVLFSGDTVVQQNHWGSNVLFVAFGHLLASLMRDSKGQECYWFLLSQGIRTYLLLPLGFKEFTPRWDGAASEFETGLLRHLARKRYGDAYDERRGVVSHQNYRLRSQFALIPEHRRDNPHVRYFLERNPGYVRGEELACLCRISAENFCRRTAALVSQA
jgi:hypothetical protein